MKTIKMLGLGLLLTCFVIFLSGCYGSFGLTKKVYNWNGSMGDKFVQEVVFLGLVIIPVYEVAGFVDVVILNLIEFWTGSNPVALKNGENHIKFNGKDVKVYVSENSAIIYDNEKIVATLDYNKYNQTWYMTSNGKTHRLMSVKGNVLTAYDNSGKILDSKIAASN